MSEGANIKLMTKGEREAAAKLIRERVRLAKLAARERSARLLADFEQQADREYRWNEDAVWREAVLGAQAEVKEAQAKIERRCRELGIPSAFAPTLSVSWHQQRASVGSERAKMRTMARRRIEQIEASAINAIERAAVAAQEALLMGGMQTQSATLFVEQLPSIDELMPQIDMGALQQQLIEQRQLGQGFGGGRLGYHEDDH